MYTTNYFHSNLMFNLNQTLIDFKDFYSLESLLDFIKNPKPPATWCELDLLVTVVDT